MTNLVTVRTVDMTEPWHINNVLSYSIEGEFLKLFKERELYLIPAKRIKSVHMVKSKGIK